MESNAPVSDNAQVAVDGSENSSDVSSSRRLILPGDARAFEEAIEENFEGWRSWRVVSVRQRVRLAGRSDLVDATIKKVTAPDQLQTVDTGRRPGLSRCISISQRI